MAFVIKSNSHLPLKIFISFLLLQQDYYHANSQAASPISSALPNSESFAFGFPSFEPDNRNIFLLGDASITAGILRLTKTDQLGKPIQKSVGRAVHQTPVHLWDKNTGNLADFIAGFSFVVNRGSAFLHGDGFAFFLEPVLKAGIPRNSSGGYLGLFNPETAFDPNKNQVLAVEFDSFANGWDPSFRSPHMGIDVGSIQSVASVEWPSESVPGNAIAHATISYDSESKRLSAFMNYPGTYGRKATVSHIVDLRTVLPEYVRVGFSAATGDVVETHDILSFEFEAAL